VTAALTWIDDAVAWLPLRTPTLPPATSTNTLVVGRSRLLVIEPASPYPEAQRELDDALAQLAADGREVVAIAITHHHADHVGYAAGLRDRLGVPLLAHAETARRVKVPVDRTLVDAEVVDLGEGVAVQAVFTPGHAPGHLALHVQGTGIAYAGDMVAAVGTIIVDPDDDGDMAVYLASLARMRSAGFARLVPSHGPVIEDPGALLDHYVAHRLARERKIVAAIAVEGSERTDVLARSYDDVPRAIWPLADRSLEAHLRKLEAEGKVVRRAQQLYRIDG
jgi:glyoxylase-like metal-dependent hydrolase (beta-lactamase superfamily II)